LWGNGKGKFRTKGRFASAAVRGTVWLTEDRCDGTLISVRQGRVQVTDFVRNRRITLRAGQSYLARARR
jgi:ferric-dicitrate binding protein FerR (iron transport regulator)